MTSRIHTIGLDISKNVFQVHAADRRGNVMARRGSSAAKLSPTFAS